jgi:putative DNA primase/helicase
MGTVPDPTGGVDPWLELLTNNVQDEELRQWIIAWCAYPLQNLGAKASTYLLLFGPSGTGKNLFFKPLHRIYGENAVIIDTDALKSSFTSLYSHRQFVHADELVRARGEEDLVSQRVKALVTQETLKVNRKGQPEYTIENHVNLAITSNYWDCIKLDADDRRACVVRWTGAFDRRGDQPYWADYVRWADGWGAAALHDYLMAVDLRGFDPTAWAPHTEWKAAVQDATLGAMESWVRDLLRCPTDILPLTGTARALWTAKELSVLYYGEAETELRPGKVKAMANALRNAGFEQGHGGGLVKRPSTGMPERWWVVQQRDKEWGSKEITAHLRMHGS